MTWTCEAALLSHAHNSKGVRSSRHAAAIVRKGIIVALGSNSYKTHPIMKLYGRNNESIYLHAEMEAIVRATRLGYNLAECDLYVLRINKAGEKASSKPCEGCARAITAFGLKKVFWS